MARPKIARNLCCDINCTCFFPDRKSKKGEGVTVLADEFEAIKLHDMDGLSQEMSAKRMGISQSTFARILKSAHLKIAKAIVGGIPLFLTKMK